MCKHVLLYNNIKSALYTKVSDNNRQCINYNSLKASKLV